MVIEEMPKLLVEEEVLPSGDVTRLWIPPLAQVQVADDQVPGPPFHGAPL